MSRWLIPAAAVAAAAAILTAGCGSAGGAGGGPGALDGAAAVVPADAVAFVAARTDVSTAAWHGIAKPFLKDFQTYAPALGSELDVAVLPTRQVVGLTQPHDAKKLAALAAKHDAQTRTVGGWTAIAKTGAALDAFTGATSHLADSNLFIAAMNRLPGDALVRAYANGEEAAQLMQSLPGQLQGTSVQGGLRFRYRASAHSRFNTASTDFKWVAAAVTSETGGFRVQAIVRPAGLVASGPPRFVIHPTVPYRPALVDEIPSGALAVADLQIPNGIFETAPPPPQLQKVFGSNAPLVPIYLDALLGGETAVYVRAGAPLPELTLVTQPNDTAAAARALDELLAALPATSMLHNLKLVHASIGGQFVVSTSSAGIDAFRGGGGKLSSDASFAKAAKQAGMGAETTGFVYGNVQDLLPFLTLAGLHLPQGLPSVGTVFAYGDQSNGESSYQAFVSVG
jgi:hypothetical protein